MGNSQNPKIGKELCKGCTPHPSVEKTEIGVYYQPTGGDAAGYGLLANDTTAFWGLLAFLVVLLYKIKPKKKNAWSQSKIRNWQQPERITEAGDSITGLFGRRYSLDTKPQKKLCSPIQLNEQ